jgi:hypothetical protein
MRKLWLVSWVLLGLVSIARADAVGIPDDLPPCPAGSALTVNHAGHWCREETPCADDSGCASSEQCSAAVALCVGTETYTQGGRLATDRPTTHTIRVGRGPCDASCVPPATCETSRRCTPRPTPSAPTAASAPDRADRAREQRVSREPHVALEAREPHGARGAPALTGSTRAPQVREV